MSPNRKERRRQASKRRHESRKSPTRRSQSSGESELFVTKDPLSDLPKDFLRKAIVEHGKEAAKKLPILQREFIDIAKKCDPFFFLSSMTWSALMIGMSDDGKIIKPKSKTWQKKLEQHHVELAQAIYLTIPIDELFFGPAHPHKMQKISDKLFDLSEAFQHARYVQIEEAKTEEQQHLLMLQERVRIHTQAVRNWGYYTQVLEILRRLYTPLDELCERITGLKANDFITIFDRMLRSVEGEILSHQQKLSAALFQPTKKSIIQEYTKQFGLSEDNVDSMMNGAKKNKWSKENIKYILMSHSGLFVRDIYQFKIDEIANWISPNAENVQRALDRLSFKYGDLIEFNFEHLFLGNPVWEKPLIKKDDESYFCCTPQSFFSFSFSIFDSIFSVDRICKKAHENRRSLFLETGVTETFLQAFGNQPVHSNVAWKYEKIQYETDLLIRIDCHLFIIEGKSHKISWPALRGAPKRLKRHIQEVLIDPAIQSKRLEDAILGWQSGERGKFEIEADLDLATVNEITRLSVTLEDFSTIQSNLKAVDGTGLLESGFPMAVTMSLADLQSVFDILESPIEKIHYLQRRKEIQEQVNYQADELDLLGLYIDTGFDLGEAEKGDINLVSFGMSEKIDEYFQARDQGIEGAKPRRRMTKWFGDIRNKIASRKPERWTEAALMLLNLRYEDQQRIEEHFDGLRRSLLKHRPNEHDKQNTTAVTPPNWRKIGFACVALYEDEFDDRHAIMEGSALNVFQMSHAERCLVIACDVKGEMYPYGTLIVTDRPSDLPDN